MVWHNAGGLPATAEPTPFTVQVPQQRLDDLAERLDRARFPADLGNGDWGYGVNRDYLVDLMQYWRNDFDWRRQENEVNAYANYCVELEGVPVHYLFAPGKGPSPQPILLVHGWPWTFWDYRKLVDRLSDPAAYGGDPAHAFDVIVPSLPGFGFSTPLERTRMAIWDMADLLARLMVDVLGYDPFVVHGGDYGAMVAAQLGHKHAHHVRGIHIAPRPMRLDMWNIDRPWVDLVAGSPRPEDPADLDSLLAWERRKVGHAVVNILSPQTLAYALHDSPVGLAAWLLERRHSWSDCHGDVESVFSRDELLTNFTIYWLTDSFVTSARLYQDNWRRGWQPAHDRTPVVQAPTAVTLFKADMPANPDTTWFGDYYNLQRLNESVEGGHFAAAEKPDRIARELTEFFWRERPPG
ncbi:epoxide hydrolase family protein [[Mycobacterium] nativiensis]|uniref:Alpha/beta fold hydrolase n=1 Tax=[Mycobacterium] nativiensis TaxID=2855503 RepID=A0ABU5XVI0_9MYCO|nr:epoxide hydrolase family protein [Mycolicibacter sp. MYC340]MEB3031807.1 alpha/beta fold hydrolase [Mycolicibacter sp. MYC340]